MPDIILWGGTGHARVLNEALADTDYRIVAVFDNRDIPSPLANVPLRVGREGFASWLSQRQERTLDICHFAVAIGGSRGRDRFELHEWLAREGLQPATIVHKTAWIAHDATVGAASHILAGARIATHARIGGDVIVNTGASIDHDCVIERGAHISPGAVLAGEVVVEACAFVGVGAIVLPRLRIGANAIVGAGSVVTRGVPAGTVVVGNPARPLRK